MRQPLLLLLLLLLPFLATIHTSVAKVNVTVDNVVVHLEDRSSNAGGDGLGEQFRLDRRKPLVITCRAETAVEHSVKLTKASFDWRRLGDNASISIGERRASFHTECTQDSLSCISTLTLSSPVKEEDVSVHECRVTPSTVAGKQLDTIVATGAFQSRPLIKMKVDGSERTLYDVAVWPSDTVEITCKVQGHPIGDIRWSQEQRPGFNYTNNETLRLSQLDYKLDRGIVTCESSNDFGTNRVSVFLRVKNPRAFLPPLLTIGAELLAMLAIIVSYELMVGRRRRLAHRTDEAADGHAVDGAKSD